ncbi:hypothetical protein P152DRAFT_119627 [Eremomyces bilateralis CBS 781.70]|uniref:PXA domain-containing protein n=1 Tax=Eremomyces bilateralis CBS 781.70 TaxID=1392243 RepID=A0A6G1GEP4_9PEZI|nr:uncharacterized protein P152DRAFT_119627 [Eremomyces bilateralis CBS 781.70]KAF1816340.1 hypothetical protein P152DRAFT_119627 [Eremomyces bilateralis CBS 781.70]
MSDSPETGTSGRKTPDGSPSEEIKGEDAALTEPLPSLRITALSIADRALEFLSTASNETLGACLVGLSATTYFILGRVGLVLIGVVGGVALHATWDGTIRGLDISKDAASEEKRRREVALDVAQRVLEWRRDRKGDEDAEKPSQSMADLQLLSGTRLDYSSFRPETSAALTEFTDAVVRDYVKWWYSPILPKEESFPASCEQTLVAFINSMSTHLWRKRPEDTFLNFLTNSSSIVVVYLEELMAAVSACPNSSTLEAIETYLELKPTSNLANLIDTESQGRKLDIVAEDILECYLDPKSFNCRPVKTFLREVLAKLILEVTVQKCSTEDFINGWIVYLLEEGQPESMKELESPLNDVVQEAAESARPGDITSPQESQTVEMKKKQHEQRANHRRVVSRAQEAMDDAMQEAQRLTQMIQEEDARRAREEQDQSQKTSQTNTTSTSNPDEKISPPLPQRPKDSNGHSMSASIASSFDDASESNEQAVVTPTSSQSGSHDLTTMSESRQSVDPPVHANSSSESIVDTSKAAFTSFDQLIPNQVPTALASSPERAKAQPAPLTLHEAIVTIFDDSVAGDRESRLALKTKPTADYLIQIEPRTSHYPGWMIIRKYADFENLHEVIKRISVISGVPEFSQAHAQLPTWKGRTKAQLRESLERYLTDAVRFRSLAESDGMKRFLEKDQALSRAGSQTKFAGLGWPSPAAFETMGKGMIDALTKAPKEVAGGGKALLGGVTGVFTGGHPSKRSSTSISSQPPGSARQSTSSPISSPRSEASVYISQGGRKSEDSLTKMAASTGRKIIDTQPGPEPPMERKSSYPTEGSVAPRSATSARSRPPVSSQTNSGRSSVRQSMDGATPILGGDQILTLPPPPSAIPDDYNITEEYESPPPKPPRPQSPSLSKQSTLGPEDDVADSSAKPRTDIPQKKSVPLSEQETQMTIELVFAMITSFYSLSSAWTLRRTLLSAAKSFLLRPGNPQVDSIRQLVQSTVIESNTSDAGIATHIRKLRENSLPTEEELAAWPPPLNEDEKRKLREKARKLLEARGMPAALTGVMGLAATKEAVSRVFDSLMIDKVARGLVFGVMLQALRAVTQ